MISICVSVQLSVFTIFLEPLSMGLPVLLFSSFLFVTTVLTHYNCPATVHLIYTMENGSKPTQNSVIQHK